MLWKYSQGLKQVAAQENVLFVDQYTPFINVINLGRASGVLSTQAGGPRLIPDAVHPQLGRSPRDGLFYSQRFGRT
jgi:hypothetical protein